MSPVSFLKRNARTRNTRALLSTVCLMTFLVTPALATDSLNGRGESYWGAIPARTDSVETLYHNITTPAWQQVVDAPYHLVSAPVRAAFFGLGATVIYLDERGFIYRVQRIIGPRDIPYGAVLNLQAGDLTGLGGGFTMVHDEFFGPDNRLRLGFKSSHTGHHKVILGTHFGVGHPNSYQLGAGYRMTPNARYFGIGPNSRTRDNVKSFFRQELSWFGASYERGLFADLFAGLDVRYTQIQARGPRDEDTPRLDDAYTPPNGFGERSDGVTVGFGLTHDSTDDTGRPVSGALAKLHLAYFTSTGDTPKDDDFVTYRAEWQQFLPLWLPQRGLALRAYSSWIDPIGDGGTADMAFQRLMTNDDPDLLRGYKDFRWRDRGLVAFTAEYRWPVWASDTREGVGLDAYLLTDVGQVFGNRREITSDNMTASYGGGLRLIGWHGFVGRIEYAASEEDQIFRLRADQVFQFQKGGLFHGRNPVPSR